MVKEAVSPVINPLLAYLYRTPATAELLKPLIGKGTPLVSVIEAVLSDDSTAFACASVSILVPRYARRDDHNSV